MTRSLDDNDSDDDEAVQKAKTKVKNILNCFLHFFLFQAMNGKLLFDFIKALLLSFTEDDIQILIFLLHNIGLQLRKEDPMAIQEIISMAEQKKNSYSVEIKMAEQQEDVDEDDIGAMKKKERKLGFLMEELSLIKKNQGSTTV